MLYRGSMRVQESSFEFLHIETKQNKVQLKDLTLQYLYAEFTVLLYC